MFGFIVKISVLFTISAFSIFYYIKDPPYRKVYIVVLVIMILGSFFQFLKLRRMMRNHTSISEGGYVSINDANGNTIGCLVLGIVVHRGLKYAVCQSLIGKKNYVLDVRTFKGENIWPSDDAVNAVLRKFDAKYPNLLQ